LEQAPGGWERLKVGDSERVGGQAYALYEWFKGLQNEFIIKKKKKKPLYY
jgi:hypothetical protein